MAKKTSIGPEIKKEKHGSLTRLSIRPFLDAKLANIEINTDIAPTQEGRPPQTKTWFSGVSMSTPLRATDVVIWITAMKALQEEAKAVIEKWKK